VALGFIGRVKQFLRLEKGGEFYPALQVDTGGKYNVTAKHFQAPGDDCAPLPEDLPAAFETQKSGNLAAVGVIDPKNQGIAKPGEVRRYSRDEEGAVTSQIYQQNDGTILIDNGNGFVQISPDGEILLENPLINYLFEANGTATLQNGAGIFKMSPDGSVNINGTIFDASGNITMAGGADINFGSTTYLTHQHPGGTPTGTPI